MTGAIDRNDGMDPLEREAIAWVRRLTSGQATAADAEALKLWCNRSPAHAAAFGSARQLWKDLGPAGHDWRRHAAAAATAHAGVPVPYPSVSRRFLLGGGLAAASAAAVYAAVRPPLGLWPSWMELRADYRTGTGERRDVRLSDDVSVRMNTQTSIAIQSSVDGAERVELIGGEASFSANSRGGRSLVVLAADRSIRVNTGEFDVRHLYGRIAPSVCVTCLQGQLEVERGTEATTLTPGHQLRYDSGGSARMDAVDPDLASAWQRGVLIFRFTPLADVVDEINRYRPGRIIVMNPATGRLPVSGRFRIDNLDEILTRIEQAFGAKVRSLPGGLVLLS
jgi:transmembrane sensor